MLASPAALDADDEQRKSQGKAENTMAAVVCRAANSTMESIAYHSGKHSKARSRKIRTKDGKEIDILDITAAADNVEGSAIFRATLQQFIEKLDDINRQIIAGRIKGMSEREISEIVCISNVAVHKRIAKMQKTLAAMLA